MAKAKLTLEEGLERSASKRHLTGKERHRYIGGALHNLGKSKPRSGGKSKATTHKAASASTTSRKVAPKKAAPVKHTPLPASEQIHLTAHLNSAASKGKNYNVYSIYKEGSKTPYSSQQFRKLSSAKAEAKIVQDAHNQRYKRGMF